MKSAGIVCVLMCVALAATAFAGTAQEKKSASAKPAMDEKAAMEMMQKLATPSEGHKKIDFMSGSWKIKNTTWMAPGQPPMTSEGTAEIKWILGGRYQEQRFEGTFMNMPFSGLGYTAYDNYKKKYLGVWMDTMGTSMMQSVGDFDAAGKAITSTGKMDDFTIGKEVAFKEKLTIVSQDEMVMEMWMPGPDGKDFRTMELRYTRKK